MAQSGEFSFAPILSRKQKSLGRAVGQPQPVRRKIATSKERRYLQLKITLKGISPSIWRRFVVPSDFTLEQLHDCLQIIMGWENSHLYEFIIGGKRDGKRYSAPPMDEMEDFFGDFDDFRSENAAHYDLGFLSRKGMKFLYIYDLGDSWEHEIVAENVNYEHSGDLPVFVLDGKRNCPPEDCGGSWGYTDLVEALADKKHPQHREMKDWIGKYDPEKFDVDQCNAVLANRFGLSRPPKKPEKKAVKKAPKKRAKS